MPLVRPGGWRLFMLALLILTGAGLLIVRWALDPATIRPAAEARLSALVGQPVTIGDIHVTLLPTANLVGTNIRIGAQPDVAPALDLNRIRLVPRLRSIFSRPIVIKEVQLEGLVASALRDRTGRWHVPAAVPVPAADAGRGLVIERVRLEGGRIRVYEPHGEGTLQEAASIDDLEGEVLPDADGLRFAPITGRIGNAGMRGQALLDRKSVRMEFSLDDVEDGDLPALLRLAGTERPDYLRLNAAASASISVQVDRGSARLTGAGAVRAPKVLVTPLRLDAFEAPFKIDAARLTFEPTAFAFYGGTHRGKVALDLAQTPVGWLLDSRVERLNTGDFLAALTGQDQRLDGTAAATASLRGRVGEPLDRTVHGRAHVTIVDGVIRQFPLLATINRVLRLAEGDTRDTRFERLSATLSLAGGQATTDDLVLEAREVRVEAAGTIRFGCQSARVSGCDRALALAGQAVVSAARSAAAIRSVRELSGLRNSQGELELPVTIGGTLDDPSIRIDLKAAVGKSLRDELRRRLKGLIRRLPD